MQMAKCLECLLSLKHTFLPKLFFPEDTGGVQNSSGNSRGVGLFKRSKKMEIPGRRQGLCEIPSVVRVWIFSGTTR